MPSPLSVAAPPHLRLLDEQPRRESLAQQLQVRRPSAQREFLESHTPLVERLLTRILGFDSELDDLVQEVFVRAFARVDDIRDDNLRSWIAAFAVNVAREALRRRRRKRWLSFVVPDEIAKTAAVAAKPEIRDAVHALYSLLAKMNADDRVTFTLRVIEGMELAEIATVCDVSLSTVKRRLRRAHESFLMRARRDPRLAEWVAP